MSAQERLCHIECQGCGAAAEVELEFFVPAASRAALPELWRHSRPGEGYSFGSAPVGPLVYFRQNLGVCRDLGPSPTSWHGPTTGDHRRHQLRRLHQPARSGRSYPPDDRRPPARSLCRGPVVGRDANVKAWAGYFRGFPDYVIHPHRLAVRGHQVAILGHTTGSHLGLPDEEESRETLIWVADVAEGRLKVWRLVGDTADNRRTYGLEAE